MNEMEIPQNYNNDSFYHNKLLRSIENISSDEEMPRNKWTYGDGKYNLILESLPPNPLE